VIEAFRAKIWKRSQPVTLRGSDRFGRYAPPNVEQGRTTVRRIAAIVVTAISMGTVFMAAPAQAKPLCHDPVGVCDTLCRWGIVC
jgi:hypothetical protein